VRSRLRAADLAAEAVAGLLARPARALLTVLGTVLGIAALVATLGISKTAGNQIVGHFDALAATEVVVKPAGADQPGASNGSVNDVLPWDSEQRLVVLNGVRAAGTLSNVDLGGALVRSAPIQDPTQPAERAIGVKAASAGLFGAVKAHLAAGRLFDAGHSARGDRVAVLGRAVAVRLHITTVEDQPAIYIGETLYSVIGIIDDVTRVPELLSAITIPDGTAAQDWQLSAPASVHVDTVIGAASLIARQAPLALVPNQPTLLQAATAGEPRKVKGQVASDVNTLFLILGGVSLLVGAIGIANVTLVSVIERIGEIGLRRALGATRRHIAAQFLAESAILGLVGGALGTSLGILFVVGVSLSRTWTPVLDPWLPVVAPLLGAAVGLVAGAYPSNRAASLQPVDALRGGT
jgi:ABC-type antimicrobial peptide transport system permease subunit